MEINPDSAQTLLDKIPNPEKLNDKLFSRWCILSGKIADNVYTPLLSTDQFEQAYSWYYKHGTPTEKVQLLTYWGRSYAEDGDYDKAMEIYTKAIDIAGKHDLNNSIGYVYCYIGDLYEMRTMIESATNNYKTAAEYFKKAENTKSYICALRDIGRGYARTDSIEYALSVLLMADSIALDLEDKNVKATIDNTLGNTYLIKGEYEKAKKHFFKALKQGKNKLPNYIALINLYH